MLSLLSVLVVLYCAVIAIAGPVAVVLALAWMVVELLRAYWRRWRAGRRATVTCVSATEYRTVVVLAGSGHRRAIVMPNRMPDPQTIARN